MEIVSYKELKSLLTNTQDLPKKISQRFFEIFSNYYQSCPDAYTKRILPELNENVFNQYFENYFKQEEQEKRGHSSLFIINKENNILGISTTLPICEKVKDTLDLESPEQFAKLDKIYLCPSLRGHGIGKFLLSKQLSFLTENGFTGLIVEADAGAPLSNHFYEKIGLTNVGQNVQDISEYIPGEHMVFNYFRTDDIPLLNQSLINMINHGIKKTRPIPNATTGENNGRYIEEAYQA